MTFWKTGALVVGFLGAAGVGAAVSPSAYGQAKVRVAEPASFQFINNGGGRIGVAVMDLETDAQTAGVRIDTVEDDSPAAKAGLQKGDIVVEFDGERVRSVRQFTRLVSETPPGRQVTAAVTRDGSRVSVNITPRESSSGLHVFGDNTWRVLDEARAMARIAPRPATPRPPSAPKPPRPMAIEPFLWYGGNQLGVSVSSLSDQLKEHFGVKDGVLVSSVTDDSVAAKAGVQAGDVIVSVNGSTVDDGSEVREEMADVDPGAEFTLEIVRDRKPMTLKGKAEDRRSRRSATRTIL